MPNVSNFGTQTDNAVVQGTVTDRAMVIPDIPPSGLMSVGPRVTPHFVKPSLWSALTTYHFFDAVHDAAGASYVAIKPEVPAGTELTDEDYWFLWADPNSQFADLSELVKTYNGRITQNTEDIATKAPNNHASEDATYGVGNAANYGHVRLATDDTPLTSGANDGIAATPKNVNDAIVNAESFHGKKRTILMLGNSYTTGFNGASEPYSIYKQVAYAFDKVYAIGQAACGFVQYKEHAYDFYTLLHSWFNSNRDKAANITDLAINSAVGDSIAYVADAHYGTKANNTLNGILNFCANNFPNLKRVSIFLCDALYKTARHSDVENVDVSLQTMCELHSFFSTNYNFNWTDTNSYPFEIAYCGWIGYSLINTEYMNQSDNTHPTLSGYIKLSKNWMSAYDGHLHNTIKSLPNISMDASAFAAGTTLSASNVFLHPDGYISMDISINGITSSTTLVSPNNWIALESVPYIVAKGNSTYIVNLQPKMNFKIDKSDSTNVFALRASTLDTDGVNSNNVRTTYMLL